MSIRVRLPNGFSFRTRVIGTKYNRSYRVELLYKRQVIGNVKLVPSYSSDGYFETHSNLNSEFHGKGLGARLYARAIQFGMSQKLKVKSSGYPSEDAQKVWSGNSIRKYFRIIRKPNKHDPQYNTWFAYKKKI